MFLTTNESSDTTVNAYIVDNEFHLPSSPVIVDTITEAPHTSCSAQHFLVSYFNLSNIENSFNILNAALFKTESKCTHLAKLTNIIILVLLFHIFALSAFLHQL